MDIKYYIYARKSSESADRQAQSIKDQINNLSKLASNLNLTIAKTYRESRSAKSPNLRPVFDEMIEGIRDGNANGILCWQTNRLSRNPQESGMIQQLLQDKKLLSIQTIDKEYKPEDNALLLSVENGVSNQFILDLRKNTLRGTKSKLESGHPPYLAPIGYMNDTEAKTIILDPKRADLVRNMWELMFTGSYTPKQILNIANDEWGLRTRRYKRRGNKKLSYSGIYDMFNKIFYTGYFSYDGNIYMGNYPPLISRKEFETVQNLIKKRQNPRPSKHKFAFTGLIKCAECGCYYTAEEKHKLIKSTGKTNTYIYYHCTNKKKEINCSQRKHIREHVLDTLIENEIKKYSILPIFKDWAFDIIEREKLNISDDETKKTNAVNTLNKLKERLSNLTKMRTKDMITDQEFVTERKALNKDVEKLESQIEMLSNKSKETKKVTRGTFEFAVLALKKFKNGDENTKKELALDLGSNYTMLNGKLDVDAFKWFSPINKGYKKLEERYLRLEPSKHSSDSQKEDLREIYSLWGG